MNQTHEVELTAHDIDRFLPIVGEETVATLREMAGHAQARLEGRALWNVNSTATGGGVSEMLHTLLPYVRGIGIDTRWLVISGTSEFFHITKRLHHALHGSAGDGSPLGPAEAAVYEEVLALNGEEIYPLVRPRDVVILHDPQTVGLAPRLVEQGAVVIWRCHVGADVRNEEVDRGWGFLMPYLETVPAMVYSRKQYHPPLCQDDLCFVIPPSIDPFSPKNQALDDDVVRAILAQADLLADESVEVTPAFFRNDGSPGRVDRRADVTRSGRPLNWDSQLVVQVSRWDPLKDPVGVMEGFARLAKSEPDIDAELILAGPEMGAIGDDPEATATLRAVVDHWHGLPDPIRDRVDLACLPMADLEENAAIVNALQRHAAVVVQKSLKEGFGLTVTEAMWKGRPVLASAVGGIVDQLEDGVTGLLLGDPQDAAAFASLLKRLLTERKLAETLGRNAAERVKTQFLPTRHLAQYCELLDRVDG